MKKRILCVLLTLIMLISLVPATAITAAAATNAVSENAIYVLKQLEGYQMNCKDGYIGYGAQCPDCLGKKNVNADVNCGNIMYEKEADSVLRKELKELDKAVNTFAANNGLNLAQSQHDALVLFSFQNGTAWTMGTGEFQTAIKSGATGSKFVDAICKWNYAVDDDYRRMVEANMYLNGVYSSAKPSRYVGVQFNLNGGTMAEDARQYFDVASPCTITLTPKAANGKDIFLGWYTEEEGGERVAALNATHAAEYTASCPALLELYAVWQLEGAENGYEALYTISKASLLSTTVYNRVGGDKVTTYIDRLTNKETKIQLAAELTVVEDFIDANGTLWAKIVVIALDKEKNEVQSVLGWVKVKGGNSTSTGSGLTMDLDVTVTNSYVNIRKEASITSAKKGTFSQGAVLRIIDVKNSKDGFLWGKVAAGAEDDTVIGWVALMYTNYDSVVAAANNSASANTSKVVATATIINPVNGYVNVRSDAGINNQIVGALSYGVTVDLYETKYVNGIQWGRCSTGWFCLTYANVTRLVEDTTGAAGVGFTNYVFSGDLLDVTKDTALHEVFYKTYGSDEHIDCVKVKDAEGNEVCKTLGTTRITVSNLVRSGDYTWGKTSYGWIKISGADGDDEQMKLDVVKYYVIADTLTIRADHDTASSRVDLLIKGTEFNVSKIVMIGETIWGYANKVGETDLTYWGWANLSNENVSRNGAPEASIGGSGNTGSSETATTVKMAKVVGTNSLNVRVYGATYAKAVGKLAYGTTAVVLNEKDGWYELDIDVDNDPSTGSWVSGTYLEIYEGTVGGSTGTTSGSTSAAVETGTGIVANTYTGVNIRTAPGTGNAAVGKYLTGTTVEILEVTTHGASKWGRTDKGWVCMDYIVMMDNYIPAGSVAGNATTNTGSNTSITSKIAIYAGELTEVTTVYKETATDNEGNPIGEIVRENLPVGYPVTVHELIAQVEDKEPEGDNDKGAVITTYWARINDGYIRAPGNCIQLDTLDEHAYTVMVKEAKLYEDWADKNSVMSTGLAKGTNVLVTELRIKNASVWGKIECVDSDLEGWVNLGDMDKGFASSVAPEVQQNNNASNGAASNNNTNTGSNGAATQAPTTVVGSTGNTTNGYANASGHKYTGKVINTNSVNVRASASTGANITTTLKNGASLVIYETVISEGMAWGRCDAGWIYLYYVDLTPTTGGAVDARVVFNDNTIIYADMGMTQATGSTYAKMAVVDIYEIVGKMARTDLGWIHTDNLL